MLDLLKAFPSFKAIVQDTRAIAIQGREVLFSSKGSTKELIHVSVLGERVPDCDSREESRLYRTRLPDRNTRARWDGLLRTSFEFRSFLLDESLPPIHRTAETRSVGPQY